MIPRRVKENLWRGAEPGGATSGWNLFFRKWLSLPPRRKRDERAVLLPRSKRAAFRTSRPDPSLAKGRRLGMTRQTELLPTFYGNG